jgi:hypothetical protein
VIVASAMLVGTTLVTNASSASGGVAIING